MSAEKLDTKSTLIATLLVTILFIFAFFVYRLVEMAFSWIMGFVAAWAFLMVVYFVTVALMRRLDMQTTITSAQEFMERFRLPIYLGVFSAMAIIILLDRTDGLPGG